MIYNRVEPIVDPLFPKNKLDFNTESLPWIRLFCLRKTLRSFLRQKMKAGAVFVNLTAAYDTVWHRGLTCKLLRVLPDKHVVYMIMELVRNRSFTLTIDDSKPSRLRRLQNGLPQGSVLASLFFAYTSTICFP